jgi:hypothetical protein
MTSLDVTSPAEYVTNTDEVDALALNVAADLTGSETVATAQCEMRGAYSRTEVTVIGFTSPATVNSNVVTQAFDARGLAPGHYEWIWNVTLNTGAIRSYRTLLKVESHD